MFATLIVCVTLISRFFCNRVISVSRKFIELHTVFIRINARAFIKFFVIRVRRLCEGGVYLKFNLILENNSMVNGHLNRIKKQTPVVVFGSKVIFNNLKHYYNQEN